MLIYARFQPLINQEKAQKLKLGRQERPKSRVLEFCFCFLLTSLLLLISSVFNAPRFLKFESRLSNALESICLI